jgi:hypothetical protein
MTLIVVRRLGDEIERESADEQVEAEATRT